MVIVTRMNVNICKEVYLYVYDEVLALIAISLQQVMGTIVFAADLICMIKCLQHMHVILQAYSKRLVFENS